jgi:putative membrane protein
MRTNEGAVRSAAARPGDTSPAAPTTEVRDALAYDRTHLANERTFAAWLRTGLSVAAGGIAVAHLVPEPARDSWVALLLGGAFVVLGVAVIAYGARQFARVAAELGRDSGRRSPAAPRAVFALTGVIGVLLLAVLLFLWSHRGTGRPDAARAAPSGQGAP